MSEAGEAGLRISQLAAATGIGVETIRYYERRGLLPEPPRGPSGYRRYPPIAVERVRFIRRAKELGFSLREIAELLELRTHERDQCAEVRTQIDGKLEDLDGRIADLRRVASALRLLRDECDREDPTGECPMLDALERGDMLCWCFRITGERLRRDGKKSIAFVTAKIHEGECDCERLNPSGHCCLGDLKAFLRECD